MKRLPLLLCFSLSCCWLPAQSTLIGSFEHDGLLREYLLYVPAMYDGSEPVPLVLNFHGYTSNALEQMFYGDFRPIADTAGFLLVHPQGTLFNGNAHWNVGGWTVGSTVDDVGFTKALIDTLAVHYNIDLERVYATGMSNGGYMSFLLACQLSDRIAAIASVTGSMTPETWNDCAPLRPVPVLQIHGDSDGVVPYGGAPWTKPIEEVIQFWVDFDHCLPTPTVFSLPDVVSTDGSYVERFLYDGGDAGSTVEHFKVYGGGHTWPGSGINLPGTNQDFDASAEIWRFFSQYDLNGSINDPTTSTRDPSAPPATLTAFPNPTSGPLSVRYSAQAQTPCTVFDARGRKVRTRPFNGPAATLDLTGLPQGAYFLHVDGQVLKIIKTEGN